MSARRDGKRSSEDSEDPEPSSEQLRPVFGRSGDGFVTLADGTLRWGQFGAAGVLVRYIDNEGVPWYLVVRRSPHSHMGNTWAVPGGAINEFESPVDAAVREFGEELGLIIDEYVIVDTFEDSRDTWSYWTVLLEVRERFPLPTTFSWETSDAKWVRTEELGQLNLLEPFRSLLVQLKILDD